MRKEMMRVLALMALLTMLGTAVPVPVAAAPAALEETGVYEEGFTTYTYKDHIQDTEWDIWARELHLEPLGGTSQRKPAVARDGSGNTMVAWLDYRNGSYAVHAQKLDEGGNRLWADDVRVNSGSRTVDPSTTLALAVDGNGGSVVVWQDYRNDTGDIYAQKLNASGNRLWTDDVRINSDSGTASQYAPAAAADRSGNVVVVWYDYRNGYRSQIYAQKLDESGNRLWNADVPVGSSEAASQYAPAVAVDGSGNAVVVWEDRRNGNDDVYAQKLDTSGSTRWATDVRVNSDSGTTYRKYPAVTVDSSGDTFVVWQDHCNNNYDIYAQKLNDSGKKLWAADVRVNSGDRTAYRWDPAVAVDGNGNAIAVWKDNRNDDSDIYAQKLDASGNRLWAVDVRVNSSDRTAYQWDPALAVDRNGNAVVVWEDDRNGDFDIYAQELDSSGNRLWAVDVRANSDSGTASQGSPSVAVDGSGNAIVVWQDYRNGDFDIYAQKLDTGGSKLWAADVRVNSDNGTAYQNYPAVTVDGSGNAVVVWEDHRNEDEPMIPGLADIYAQKLDGSGNKLWAADVCVNSDTGIGYSRSPSVAVDGSGNAFAVWYRYYSGIYAQGLDADGGRLWADDVCVYFQGGEVPYSAVVAVDRSGNAFVVWYGYGGSYDPGVYAQKLDRSGNKLWATDVRVSSDGGTVPTVAVDGSGNAVVVWCDHRNPSYDIYAQRLDGNGERLWAADARVNSDSGTASQASPAVAVDENGNAFVVWDDWRNGDWDIYAQRLDTGGSALWTDDRRVNSDSETTSQDSAAVGVDGSGNAIVLWGDDRDGNDDIYAQKINSVGGKGWLADLQVVYPDRFYFPTGTAQSRAVDTIADNIARATLTADYQTNGGEVQFHLTNDAGAHWARVTPGVTHLFTTTGSDLRWRAVLTADPIWLRTPVVNSLRIEYSTHASDADDYEPDNTCAQASPLQVNGAVQAHTFHQPDDEDWAWFDVTSGTTYVLQTAHAGPNADTVLELHDICHHPILTDTNGFGHDARLVFAAPSDAVFYARVTNQDGSVYGEGTDYDLSVRTYHPNGLAVVVAGHNDAWQLQSNIDYAADQAYLTLLEAGFPRANVRYLGPDPDRDVDGNGLSDDIVATATITNVRYAIQDWPREQGLALGVPFYVYLMDHGHYDQFLANGNAEKVTAPLLDLWLSNLEATTGADQITVIIDACKSGSFIDITGPGPAEISGFNRVIVASTTSEANAYPSEQGALFSDVFWTALGDNQDVWSAYQAAKAAVDARGLMQTPWLDDNGDAVANEEDGDLARGRGLAGVFGGSEPVIDWLTVGEIGAGGTATVAAQVRDDFAVMRVHVEVYPPGYEEPEGGPGETPVVGVPTTTLTLAGDDVYVATLTGLTAPGSYRAVGYAVDDEGNWALPRWIVVEGQGGAYHKVYLPLILR